MFSNVHFLLRLTFCWIVIVIKHFWNDLYRAGHRNPSIRFYGTLRTVPVTVPSVFWQAFYTVRVMVRAGPVDPVDGTMTVDGSRVPCDNVYPALIDSSIPSK